MRGFSTLAIVLAFGVALAGCASSANGRRAVAPPSQATSVDASIIAAALAQNSVHWTEFQNLCHVRWTADVTADSGAQRVTIGFCGAKGNVEMRLVDDVVYVRGNPTGLESESTIYLTEAQARRYAGRWIAIPKGSQLYGVAADGLTLASIVHDVDARDYNLKIVRTPHATRVLGFDDGNPPGPSVTLSAQASGDPLPVAMTGTGCVECVYTGGFSKWNEPVHVHAPARSTPIATVCGRCSRVWPVHG